MAQVVIPSTLLSPIRILLRFVEVQFHSDTFVKYKTKISYHKYIFGRLIFPSSKPVLMWKLLA